ncbi:MAG TPA: hypothetical protein VG097_17510 [Gemmata sp.]|nr:hypothetical protein [Gemmata sp.]
MYRAYGLLKPDSDFNMDQALARLTPRFPGYSITRTGDRISISKGDWEIELALASGSHIPAETQGITDKIAGMEGAETDVLFRSERRVEVGSETPDPFMEHFNDFLQVVEVLKSFNGLVAVDPHERALL